MSGKHIHCDTVIGNSQTGATYHRSPELVVVCVYGRLQQPHQHHQHLMQTTQPITAQRVVHHAHAGSVAKTFTFLLVSDEPNRGPGLRRTMHLRGGR